jgi:hypothetical protein
VDGAEVDKLGDRLVVNIDLVECVVNIPGVTVVGVVVVVVVDEVVGGVAVVVVSINVF